MTNFMMINNHSNNNPKILCFVYVGFVYTGAVATKFTVYTNTKHAHKIPITTTDKIIVYQEI